MHKGFVNLVRNTDAYAVLLGNAGFHMFTPGCSKARSVSLMPCGSMVLSIGYGLARFPPFIPDKKKPAPIHQGMPAGFAKAQTINRFASSTSKLSPSSWLRTSRPVSGMSPDVDWLTAIFLAMRRKQSICAVSA